MTTKISRKNHRKIIELAGRWKIRDKEVEDFMTELKKYWDLWKVK